MFVEEKAKGEVKELDEASQILMDAAALIEKHGFWKNGSGLDGRCAMLAIAYIAKGRSYTEARLRFTKAIGGSDVRDIYSWNDAHSKDEVIAKLRAVALSGQC